MAGVSVSHLIIFTASLVVAAGVAGTLTTGVDRISGSIEDGSIDVSQQVRTDITVVSDPGYTYNTTENVTIHIRNTGSQGIALQASSFDIIFNGVYQSPIESVDSVTEPGSATWRPGEVVVLDLGVTPEDGDNRLFVTVNRDEEKFEFRAS
jgi:flagellar protein FlaG